MLLFEFFEARLQLVYFHSQHIDVPENVRQFFLNELRLAILGGVLNRIRANKVTDTPLIMNNVLPLQKFKRTHHCIWIHLEVHGQLCIYINYINQH